MILYIASRFPALTVTFIYREVATLRERGLEVCTVSMNRPQAAEISSEAQEFLATSLYLDQVSLFGKLWAFLRLVPSRPRAMIACLKVILSARPMNGVRDYLRLIYHWIEACYLYREYRGRGLTHIHAHFVNGPTSIAMFLGLLTDLPFSFTMHASMIWRDPIALANKLDLCAFCVSISEYNKDFILSEYGTELASKIHIVRCGIYPSLIQDPVRKRASSRLEILGIGQLNARKGFEYLLEACSILKDRGLSFHCTIVGEGEERAALESLRASLGLGERVSLVGAKTQEELTGYFETADAFVLPCVISRDGWRDGIPVALMEATAWRIPVITTNILGLPELVQDGESGLLVEPERPDQLAAAIERLHEDFELRDRLVEGGVDRVRAEFNVEVSAQRLATLFDA